MQGKSRHATRFGGQLQTAPGEAIEPLDLPHHGRKTVAAQPLLHRPEQIGFAFRAHHDEAPGIEPQSNQRRGIEIAPARYPENVLGKNIAGSRSSLAKPRQEREAEAKRHTVVPFRALALDLVQSAERQTAAGQSLIQGRQPQRQHRPPPGASAARLDPADPGAQGRQPGLLSLRSRQRPPESPEGS